MNKRLPQQAHVNFPMYGFLIVGSRRDPSIGPKRWKFLGLLEYLRHYPDTQVDSADAKSEAEVDRKALVELARKDSRVREGELEIDDNAVVSFDADNGAYVQV